MKILSVILVIGLLACLPVRQGYWVTGAAFAQEEASSPAKSVRDALKEKIEEKLTQLASQPKAVIGKVTDIQDGSLLAESKNGIKQLRLDEELTIVDTREKNKKEIETKDLQIGDLIVAMGHVDTKDVLDTQRILVIKELPTSTKRATYGEVTEVKKDSLVIKHPKTDDTWTIKTDSKTKVTGRLEEKIEEVEFGNIRMGDRLAIVGIPDKAANTLLAKLIHIIPGNAFGLETKATPRPTTSPKPSSSPKPTTTL